MKLFSAEVRIKRLSSLIDAYVLEGDGPSSLSRLKVLISKLDECMEELRSLEYKVTRAKCLNSLPGSDLSVYEAELLVRELDKRAAFSLSASKIENSPVDYYAEFSKQLELKSSVEEQLYLAKISIDI